MHVDATPLYAVAPPQWMCGTQAAGALLPRNEQALQQLAYWECWRETAMRQWVNAMPTGMRDFGDAYMGGPYKGRHAYANLEYDVAMDFLHQFLRTGDAWYLETAEPPGSPSGRHRHGERGRLRLETQPAPHHHTGGVRPCVPARV